MEKEKANESTKICGVIRSYCFGQGMNIKSLANKVDIKYSTLTSRMRNPETFRVGELIVLYDFLDVPPEKRLLII